jgi:hypothetical protein
MPPGIEPGKRGKTTFSNRWFEKKVLLRAGGVMTQPGLLAALRDAGGIVIDIMEDTAHPVREELDQPLRWQPPGWPPVSRRSRRRSTLI